MTAPAPTADHDGIPDPAAARRTREQAGWSRFRVAVELGVTEMTIWRWEHGVVPGGRHLLAYMRLLDRLDQEAGAA